MFLLIVFLMCLFVAVGTGILAGWSDYKGMIIPNIYSVMVIASFALAYIVLSLGGRGDVFVSLFSHLFGGVIVFIVTLVMFAMKGIGGGDAKLATAFAFWTGVKGLFPFLFYMSIWGGVLAVLSIVLKKYTPIKNPPEGSWLAQCQDGANKVPYGIAIVAGALASFAHLGYFSGETLSSFLFG